MDSDVKLIYDLVVRMDEKINSIQEVQQQHGIVHAQNTMIVKQHESRSTELEKWVSKIHGIMIALEEKVEALAKKVHVIEKSNASVNSNINNINADLHAVKLLPKLLKFLLLIIALVSALFGAFKFLNKG